MLRTCKMMAESYSFANISPSLHSPSPYSPWKPPFHSISMTVLIQICHVCEVMQHLCFCVWFISLSIISSRFIHVVANSILFYGSVLRVSHCKHTLFSLSILALPNTLLLYIGNCEELSTDHGSAFIPYR